MTASLMSLTLAQEMLNVKLNKKISIFPLGGPPIGSGQNAHLVNCGLLTALTRFHGDLAQEVN